MSVSPASGPISVDDDAVSVVSTGTFVYEDPWEGMASDDGDTDVCTSDEGTIRILERTAAEVPVLSASDAIKRQQTYGLRMIIPTRIGRVDDVWQSKKILFKQTKHLRLPFPFRPNGVPGEEGEILLNKGLSWDIDVIAPTYAPDADTESAKPFTWNVEGCFHPNWFAWKRQVADNSFRISAGQTRWSTAIAQFFMPVDGGLQRAGRTFDKSLELPTHPVTVHGFGICDPNKYRWKDDGDLPGWLDLSERNNTMGFLRMSTRFNMQSPDQGDMSKIPPSGDYPFHVLLYWPRSAKFLRRTRWVAAINKGGFFRTENRVLHFVGKMIGLLKTSLLRDVPLGIYIPVIIPYDVNYTGGAGHGAGDGQFAEMKQRTTPKKNTKDAEGRNSGDTGTASSPTGSSPSAARFDRGPRGSSSAQKLHKSRLDALLGIESDRSFIKNPSHQNGSAQRYPQTSLVCRRTIRVTISQICVPWHRRWRYAGKERRLRYGLPDELDSSPPTPTPIHQLRPLDKKREGSTTGSGVAATRLLQPNRQRRRQSDTAIQSLLQKHISNIANTPGLQKRQEREQINPTVWHLLLRQVTNITNTAGLRKRQEREQTNPTVWFLLPRQVTNNSNTPGLRKW
ncbi:hypothetical protein F5883DRAFT_663951 [Diaporthe sp. PMI_573]|nr:hypothetical protein F5883DRAFT_663951 [Diaporthaceae sp. PMI_573]